MCSQVILAIVPDESFHHVDGRIAEYIYENNDEKEAVHPYQEAYYENGSPAEGKISNFKQRRRPIWTNLTRFQKQDARYCRLSSCKNGDQDPTVETS